MAQYARPESDVTAGTWVTTPLYSQIDEATPSDTDYIDDNALGYCEVLLSDVTDPTSAADHVVRYRYGRNPTNRTVTLVVSLRQGTGTEIASWEHVDPALSFVLAEQTLTAEQANAISDYGDLRLRFTISAIQNTQAHAQVSWAELEVPAYVPSAQTVTLGLLSPTALYAPTVAREEQITLPLLSAASLYGPAVTPDQPVTLPALDPLTLYEPTVTFGDQYATLPPLTATSIYEPAVAYGDQYTTLPLLAATAVYAPAVAPVQVVTLDLLEPLTILPLAVIGVQTVTLPLLEAASLLEPAVIVEGTTVARLTLETASAPQAGDCWLHVRARNMDNTGILTVAIYEGSTQRVSQQFNLTDTFTTYDYEWSAEAAAIIDWTDLEIRWQGAGPGEFQVSGVWAVIPELEPIGDQWITLGLLAATTVYEPTVAEEQPLILPALALTVLYGPAVTTSVVLPLISPAVLYEPTVLLVQEITLPLVEPLTLYAPDSIAPCQPVTLDLLSPLTLYGPMVSTGLELPRLDPLTVYEPDLIAVCQPVTLPLLEPLTVYEPTLVAEPVLVLPLIAGTVLYQPTLSVEVTLPLLEPVSLYEPTLVFEWRLELPLLQPVTIYAPASISKGYEIITLPVLAALTLYAPTEIYVGPTGYLEVELTALDALSVELRAAQTVTGDLTGLAAVAGTLRAAQTAEMELVARQTLEATLKAGAHT